LKRKHENSCEQCVKTGGDCRVSVGGGVDSGSVCGCSVVLFIKDQGI
jgi:hypothetical protein